MVTPIYKIEAWLRIRKPLEHKGHVALGSRGKDLAALFKKMAESNCSGCHQDRMDPKSYDTKI